MRRLTLDSNFKFCVDWTGLGWIEAILNGGLRWIPLDFGAWSGRRIPDYEAFELRNAVKSRLPSL